MTRQIGVAIILAAGLLTLAHGAVRADFSLSVSPTLAEFTADPGGSIVQPITLVNEGSEKINLVVSLKDLFDGRQDLSATDWFEVSPDKLEIPPGEQKEVAVRIVVPKDASAGGHYVAVVFQTGVGAEGGQTGFISGGAGVGARIESVFLMTVKSKSEEQALVLASRVEKVVPIARAKDTLGFRVEIFNAGNVHFYPKGEIEVYEESGNVVGKVTLPETPPVYPGTSRSFEFAGTVTVPVGDYSAKTNVTYGWEDWQAKLADQNPEDWVSKEAESAISFNSEPKLDSLVKTRFKEVPAI